MAKKQYTPQEVQNFGAFEKEMPWRTSVANALPIIEQYAREGSPGWQEGGGGDPIIAYLKAHGVAQADIDNIWSHVNKDVRNNPLNLLSEARNSRMYVDQYTQYASPPQTDPQLLEVQKQQQAQAQNFEQDIPNLSRSLMTGRQAEARQALADRLHTVNIGANRRGLFYSGARVKAQGAERADVANTLMGDQQKVNQGLLDASGQLKQRAIDTGFQIANHGQNTEGAYLNALQQGNDFYDNYRKQTQSNIAGSMKDLGTGLGTIFGSFGKKAAGSGALTGLQAAGAGLL